jgi:hypothetical protein
MNPNVSHCQPKAIFSSRLLTLGIARRSHFLVDATTLIVISTIVQTVVITITLGIFVLQVRSQERSIHEASYQGLMGRYNDFIRGLAESPTLAKILVGDETISPEEAMVYGHMMVAYGIIEEAFLLRTRKWITEDEWKQWSAFLSALAARPQMKTIVERSRGTFDGRFEEYASRVFKEVEGAAKKIEKELGKKEGN